jgi:hypothetical protein
MGESEVKPSPKFAETFCEHYPHYLHIGMTHEQYWQGDVSLVKDYRQKAKLDLEHKNYLMWLQERYAYEANSIVHYNLNRDKKKGQKAKDYPIEPHRITPMTESEKAEKVRKDRQKVIDYFTGFEKDFNNRNEKKRG